MSKVDANAKVMTPDGKTQLVIGLGVTLGVGSDCYPYTLVDFNAKGTVISVSADKYKRTDSNGLSESQEYEYTTDPNAPVEKLRWSNKFKCYRTAGGSRYHVGHRRAYQNPSF